MQNETKVKISVDNKMKENKGNQSVNNNGTKKLSDENLIEVLKMMITSRTMDIKIMNMLKQGKSYFHLPSSGHEATQIAFGMLMNKGVDWAYPYYRDMAFMIGLGTKIEDILLHQLAKEDDPLTG